MTPTSTHTDLTQLKCPDLEMKEMIQNKTSIFDFKSEK